MEIVHVSAECYPMAKAGGLADVTGALPRYQQMAGHVAKVVVPMHRTKFLYENDWEVVHKGAFSMADYKLDYTIIKEKTNKLGFDLYCVDIYGLLDREKIYGYDDDTERFTSFQIAVTDWISKWNHLPDIVHVHDHHTGLIPFMMKYCYAFGKLASIPVVLTVHNAQYQGWMPWQKATYIPAWDTWQWGLLDWDNMVNPLATAIKCSARVTTVSPGYFRELMYAANGLEHLFISEQFKCEGILNGIDYLNWDPRTDTYILDNFELKDMKGGKQLNKKKLCDDFELDIRLPLFVFIGRLVGEKGADLLAPAIMEALEFHKRKINFIVLGSGEPAIENQLDELQENYKSNYTAKLEYNEKLSHQLYAGADFLLMPSRVEPCGLNQMYAMRYATVPVVRSIGGLKDTVIDMGEEDGFGITFNNATIEDIVYSIERSVQVYKTKRKLEDVRKKMMQVDNSWESRAEAYSQMYLSIKKP